MKSRERKRMMGGVVGKLRLFIWRRRQCQSGKIDKSYHYTASSSVFHFSPFLISFSPLFIERFHFDDTYCPAE